ncbi:hypothetical protein HDU76_007111, partial [Blyttiomyces sp. JEL0837]
VKKRKYLLNALSVTPAYLRNPATESGLVFDFRDWQVPLGRRFRSLKLWFVLRTYGLSGIRDHIRKHCAQAHRMKSHLETEPTLFKLISGPNFALITFQIVPPTSSSISSNELTKLVCAAINNEGSILLTPTVLNGVDVIRFVSGSPWTTDEHVDRAFEVICRVAKEVVKEKAV